MRTFPGIASATIACLLFAAVLHSAAQEEIKSFGRRIIGGEPTTIDEHLWQVALNLNINDVNYLCGGSIIADRWVLTAAHCFGSSTKPHEVKVKAGATNYQSEGRWSEVEKVVIHEAYNAGTHEHDLALIRLRTHPSGQIIPLASSNTVIPVGQPLEVTGWGTTTEGGEAASGFRKASVPYADNAACNVPSAYNGGIKPGMMCAGYREGGVDSCQGDSGGPLVLRTEEGPVLVGVVSWGEGCARKLRYGVYTRVASYADWIVKVVMRGGS
jgi:secreted trypsin-like serine protease